MESFQGKAWKNGSIGGAVRTTTKVVAFIVSSLSQHFPREAEKIDKKRGDKNPPLENWSSGRVRPEELFDPIRINVDQSGRRSVSV